MKRKLLSLGLATGLGLSLIGCTANSTTGQGMIGADLSGLLAQAAKDPASQTLDIQSPQFGTLHWARNGGATNAANYGSSSTNITGTQVFNLPIVTTTSIAPFSTSTTNSAPMVIQK